jgi:ParB family transcriptional regulator, chromosome partitioning protein
MRLPWRRSNSRQLDLLGDAPVAADESSAPPAPRLACRQPVAGRPASVPVASIDEDPANPRADFPEAELDDLAADIRSRGILVPLVVHPADADGRHRLHFGARRLRAAMRAGLQEVPVVVREAPADRYAQVAENLKRAGLAPLDLARFIRQQMAAGESQAEVSRRLGMNLTTVAHHLSLLELPPVLTAALESGRCSSPRTLHELSKVNDRHPQRVKALLDGQGPITRVTVAALRDAIADAASSPIDRLLHQADAACERLERLLGRIEVPTDSLSLAGLAALRARVEALPRHLPQWSDGQTPDPQPR